jgi:hypothetical protein
MSKPPYDLDFDVTSHSIEDNRHNGYNTSFRPLQKQPVESDLT